MFLIGISSIISLAIFIERFFYLKKTEKDNKTFLDQLFQKINKKEIPEAIVLCDHSKNIMGSVISKTVLIKSDRSRSELKDSIEEAANREIPKLETRISILGTIASIAPLLGLLGTVLGLISSLEVLSKEGQSTIGATEDVWRIRLLEGIWTALITTAGGLIVAIPSLTGYNYLVSKISNLVTYTRNKTIELIEIIGSQSD
ncbi:MAG: MotA/TolQ/ExbB proton channel family protein [Spirochaetota bacterium]|nr:MotA/TolQ/ExbB proton channel family protein [Spirochaetota bacterium]